MIDPMTYIAIPLDHCVLIGVLRLGKTEQCRHPGYGIPKGGISDVPPNAYPNTQGVNSELLVHNQGMLTFCQIQKRS